MATEVVEVLIEGGKATAAPPLGPALGPLKVNIGQIVADINKKTQDFKGMQVPVKVEVNTETKEYNISIGTPPASQLIIKEANVKKGSSNPMQDYIADLKMEQIIKISKMKEDALLGKDPVQRVREILGTCQSMGVMVEGKNAKEILDDMGEFKKKIMSGKTELTATELKEQEEERVRLQAEIAEKRDEFLETANGILSGLGDAEISEKRKALLDADIPMEIVNELAPEPNEPAKK